MTKSKKSIVMRGALLRPLVIGQGALLHAGGKIYHTSRVVAIHDQSDDMVRFETLNSNYCLSMAPFPLAACNPLPMVSLAACAQSGCKKIPGQQSLSYMFWAVTDFPPRPFFGGLSWMIKKQW